MAQIGFALPLINLKKIQKFVKQYFIIQIFVMSIDSLLKQNIKYEFMKPERKEKFRKKILEDLNSRVKDKRRQILQNYRGNSNFVNVPFPNEYLSEEQTSSSIVQESDIDISESDLSISLSSGSFHPSYLDMEELKIFEESDLINFLGYDSYHEVLCKIEREIQSELACDDHETDFDRLIQASADNPNDSSGLSETLLDSYENDQIICPNCRYKSTHCLKS
jgi:hypothetical protein